MNNSVVGVRVGVAHTRGAGGANYIGPLVAGSRVNTRLKGDEVGDGSSTTEDEKVLGRAELIVDLDVVEGEGRDRKRDTSVLTEPEGKHNRKVTTEKGAVGTGGYQSRSRSGVERRSKRDNVADHVLVDGALGGGATEVEVEIQPVVVELLDGQLVEGDRALLDDVVHEVAGPPDGVNGRGNARDAVVVHQRRDLTTEPKVQNVITGPVKGRRDTLLTEVEGAVVTKLNRHGRKPVSLLNASDEKGDGERPAIEETLKFRKGRQVNKTRSGLSSRISSHLVEVEVNTTQYKNNHKKRINQI